MRDFLDHQIIKGKTLRTYLENVKTNLELKMLAYLFGGRFNPDPSSSDGTGCYIFTQSSETDIFTLKTIIDDGVILWLAYHWAAVKDLSQNKDDKWILVINDPNGTQKRLLFTQLNANYRFYSYKFDRNLREEMDTLIRSALNLQKNKF